MREQFLLKNTSAGKLYECSVQKNVYIFVLQIFDYSILLFIPNTTVGCFMLGEVVDKIGASVDN
jgi:hypothetical protein